MSAPEGALMAFKNDPAHVRFSAFHRQQVTSSGTEALLIATAGMHIGISILLG